MKPALREHIVRSNKVSKILEKHGIFRHWEPHHFKTVTFYKNPNHPTQHIQTLATFTNEEIKRNPELPLSHPNIKPHLTTSHF